MTSVKVNVDALLKPIAAGNEMANEDTTSSANAHDQTSNTENNNYNDNKEAKLV